MNGNETRTLWISVIAALFAVFLLYSYTQEKTAEYQKKFGAMQRVVVAKVDINEMQTIEENMVELRDKPTNYVQPGALNDVELAVGQVALAPIRKDEQILDTKVIKPGVQTGLALQVSPTKRAISIPVSDMNAVSHLIRPGDRIDVVAALDVGKGIQQHREVKTLMQDVTVLATGQQIMNQLPLSFEKVGSTEGLKSLVGDTSFSTITIEASPEESQNLIYLLSSSPGSIFLTLRHPSDHSRPRFPESTIDTLLGKVSQDMLNLRQPAALPPPPPMPAPVKKKKKKGPFIDL